MKIDVAFSFDTTGSMYPCLAELRRRLRETLKRLHSKIPGIRIALIAHGDYCDEGTKVDGQPSYVTRILDFTTNIEELVAFVMNVGQTDGGDLPECYELVLHQAHHLNWQADKDHRVLVMIGDNLPHEPNYSLNKMRLDWRKELKELINFGVKVYGVQAFGRHYATEFYNEIAKITGGFKLNLDQFYQIADIVEAICLRQSDDLGPLTVFEEELIRAHRMNRSMRDIFNTMYGCSRRVDMDFSDTPDLEAVPPSRFQVLHVDHDVDIAGFVRSTGARFHKGKGFYQFIKKETVQERKEVVLRDKRTGDMFTGKQAREMIGLPLGIRSEIKPVNLEKFDVFVQSTSVNRKLKAGTMFLYEDEDWDK